MRWRGMQGTAGQNGRPGRVSAGRRTQGGCALLQPPPAQLCQGGPPRAVQGAATAERQGSAAAAAAPQGRCRREPRASISRSHRRSSSNCGGGVPAGGGGARGWCVCVCVCVVVVVVWWWCEPQMGWRAPAWGRGARSLVNHKRPARGNRWQGVPHNPAKGLLSGSGGAGALLRRRQRGQTATPKMRASCTAWGRAQRPAPQVNPSARGNRAHAHAHLCYRLPHVAPGCLHVVGGCGLVDAKRTLCPGWGGVGWGGAQVFAVAATTWQAGASSANAVP
jgi:hypothetical protein